MVSNSCVMFLFVSVCVIVNKIAHKTNNKHTYIRVSTHASPSGTISGAKFRTA